MVKANGTSPAVYIVIEADIQGVAKERIGRELNSDEMRSVVRYFDNGINWHEVAERAIDGASDDQ